MFKNLSVLTLAVMPALASVTIDRRGPLVDPRFQKGVKFQIEIQEELKQGDNIDLVPDDAVVWDIDLFQAIKTEVIPKFLKKKKINPIVLCYFSVGTLHDGGGKNGTGGKQGHVDEDLDQFANVKTGDRYRGFPDEVWLDITDPKVLTIMKNRIDRAKAAGCDGIDPDNIDGYKLNRDVDVTPFPNQNGLKEVGQKQYQEYFNKIIEYAHSKDIGLLVGQKNAPELTADSVNKADFAVLEECMKPDEREPKDVCGSWQAYVKQNKPVFEIEYPPSVQACDVDKDGKRNAPCEPEKLVCETKAPNEDEIKRSCKPDTTKNNNAGFSVVLKQDGATCGLGNWTSYCDKTDPIFIPLDFK